MSGSLQQILEEVVGRIPKPEPIVLEVSLDAVNLKSVAGAGRIGPNGSMAADVVLRARFRVTNKSRKAAHGWTVNCEVTHSEPSVASRIRHYPNPHSTEMILSSGSALKNVEFGFRFYQNERMPLPFTFRALMGTSLRFHTVSEDGPGESKTQHISEVVDQDELYHQIHNALRNHWQGV